MVSMGITTAYYFSHPLDMIDIRRGGLGIPGAVIGGVLALFFYARAKKISFSRWVDYIAPGLILAQGVGRWGNFVNQELYGAPTSLPWKLYIDPQHRLSGYQDVEYYHPLFLYESIYNFAIMGFLLFISRKYQSKLRDGDVFLVYLILYPIGRFFLEFLRLDPSSVAAINANQTVMGVIAIVSALALLVRHRIQPSQQEAASPSDTNSES